MALPLAASEYINWIWGLPIDLAGRFRSEARQSRRGTYAVLRRFYALSRGRSRHAVRGLFRLARPARPQLDARGASIVDDLRERGIAVASGYLPQAQRARILKFLDACEAVQRNRVRDDYRPEDLLESPDIRALVADPFIHDVAAAYLGSTPIFTQLSAWWSRSDPEASTEDLSEAAQLFHYDYDWPAFVKFFIYLTDVGPENGPFTFVVGTHERKRHWGDGRRDDAYIASTYPDAAWPVTGQAGDLIIADTVGYHKGERVRSGERLMLQMEFAVSRIGASFQYRPLPARHRPNPSITFDAFSA
jgi:hypothetical protein